MSQTVMIAGCGDVGGRLGEALLADGWRVHGLRRSVDALPQGILPVAGDLQAPECPAQWPSEPLDYLVYSAAASQHDEAGYRAAYVDGLRHVLGWLQAHGQRPRRLLFVSSTGVYAQTDGGWIDEESPALSQAYSGRIMLDAEQVALDSGIPATRVRLAGIYGPGREWLLNQVRQGYRVVSEPPLYANRIHADDAAGLLAFLLRADAGGQALAQVVDHLVHRHGRVVDTDVAVLQRLGVSQWADEHSVRRAGSKRCSNRRARALGWVPRYPSYREGYAAVLGDA